MVKACLNRTAIQGEFRGVTSSGGDAKWVVVGRVLIIHDIARFAHSTGPGKIRHGLAEQGGMGDGGDPAHQ